VNMLVAVQIAGRSSIEPLKFMHLVAYTGFDHRLAKWIADPVGARSAGEMASHSSLPIFYIRWHRGIRKRFGEIEVEPDRQIRVAR